MRISASSYSNTAPLIWAFLYGSRKGSAELILDNAPSRSAALLAEKRVNAALVPVITYQTVPDLFVVPDVCVGARESVQSVCLVTRGRALEDVRTVALDTSSKTSVAMTKIVFREFFSSEPQWLDRRPDVPEMLEAADCALLIGDPALTLVESGSIKKFDLVEVWKKHTGLGFVFAMWMTHTRQLGVDFTAARDEGLRHVDEIIANYHDDIELSDSEMREYLTSNISFDLDESMQKGLELFFELAEKLGIIGKNLDLRYTD